MDYSAILLKLLEWLIKYLMSRAENPKVAKPLNKAELKAKINYIVGNG